MSAHALVLRHNRAVTSWTKFGWHAECTCGWNADSSSTLWGSKKSEQRAYYRHKASSEKEVEGVAEHEEAQRREEDPVKGENNPREPAHCSPLPPDPP